MADNRPGIISKDAGAIRRLNGFCIKAQRCNRKRTVSFAFRVWFDSTGEFVKKSGWQYCVCFWLPWWFWQMLE